MNASAKSFVSGILPRTDLVDEDDSTEKANAKIGKTNDLIKAKCASTEWTCIDNDNVEAGDFFDGVHLNTVGGV